MFLNFFNFQSGFDPIRDIQDFLDCTFPCGVLTVTLGIVLLIGSIIGFIILLEKSICNQLDMCANPLLTIGSISALVFGTFIILIGFIIIYYNKKEETNPTVIFISKITKR
jgi:hypothetical protein